VLLGQDLAAILLWLDSVPAFFENPHTAINHVPEPQGFLFSFLFMQI